MISCLGEITQLWRKCHVWVTYGDQIEGPNHQNKYWSN